MIDGIQLKDTFAMKNTNKISYTYIHTNGKSTIDRIVISKDYNSKLIVSCEHRIFPPSDHLAVILTIERERVNKESPADHRTGNLIQLY